MSEDLTGVVPEPDVAEELRALLRADPTRVGDTFRGIEAGLNPREIADGLGVPTHGFHYNNLLICDALLNGRISTAPVRRRVVRQRLVGWAKQPGLSDAARAHIAAVMASYEGDLPVPPHTLDTFISWAAAFGEAIDIPAEEDSYKLEFAARIGVVRDQMLAGHEGWFPELRRALQSVNLVHWTITDSFTKALSVLPDQGASVLLALWEPEPAHPGLLDAFRAALRSQTSAKLPDGATLSVGSTLQMARDPQRFVPFRATFARQLYQLSASEPPKPASIGERYAAFLGWLDEFARSATESGLEIPDRLVAHGYAWTVTKYAPPAEWPESQRAQLLAWRGESAEPPRAWLVRPKAAATLEDWLSAECTSVAGTHLGAVPPGSDRASVKAAVESGYEHVDYAQRETLTGEYYAFLSRMRPGDVVATQSGDRVYLGRITGEAEYTEDGGDRLFRTVDWVGSTARAELAAPLPALLDQQGTVVELTPAVDALLELLGAESFGIQAPDDLTPPDPPTLRPPVVSGLSPVTAAMAAGLYCDVEPLREIVELLASRRQVVLYGPPGTGKTYIAMALARHIVGEENSSHTQLVQFHPSYAYEDFFEGYRPTQTDAGQATFSIQAGPLRRIASDAKANPGLPFVLIIDELNRANLAKVFGELYFLLEYRDRTIRLQYRPEEAFQLPPNLFIIGTMNTADRSIALLDAAMRRRFAFFELHPDEPPVRDVLANFLAANHKDGDPRAGLLSALNAAIADTDRDFKIGPSYLMRPEAENEAGLERIWRHDILPLLEEHYYGRMERKDLHGRFGLKALRQAINPAPDADEPIAESAPEEGQ